MDRPSDCDFQLGLDTKILQKVIHRLSVGMNQIIMPRHIESVEDVKTALIMGQQPGDVGSQKARDNTDGTNCERCAKLWTTPRSELDGLNMWIKNQGLKGQNCCHSGGEYGHNEGRM